MNGKEMLAYGLSKRGAVEEAPFGPGVVVLKVGGKIFAILGVREARDTVSLKCDPEYAELLRRQYACIQPGYHLNKRHWNTIDLDGGLSDAELEKLLEQSYALVVKGLPRRTQALL
ncbi:MmcQ/YjbR family DNA-binding protein [Azotosporobacter soli]|uniref:MmcQ/YjbR family DNA-binding protein n=1 Tax=Azotosporobacter soli TaxID=3055040 RepID=UPI0031FF2D5A